MATTNTSRLKPRTGVGWGNPVVYLAALLLIGIMLGPVIYIIIGGFRTNSQITVNPASDHSNRSDRMTHSSRIRFRMVSHVMKVGEL